MSITGRQFDRSFLDLQSVGESDFCQHTSVGNAVSWCSDYLVLVMLNALLCDFSFLGWLLLNLFASLHLY